MKNKLGIALGSLWISACPAGPGITPPTDRIFFPVSVASDPDGQKLYVSNGNFNTLFDGGTVVSFDLAELEAAGLACRAAQEAGGPAPQNCQIARPFPPTLCLVEGERCSVTDPTSPFIDKEATVSIASFPSDFVRSPDGSRLYFVVRGDQSLSFIDIDPSTSGAASMSCFSEADGEAAQRRHCTGNHVLLSDRETGIPEFGTLVPGFATGVFTATLDIGRSVSGAGLSDLMYVSHLDNGLMSLFRLTPDGTPVFQKSQFVSAGINQLVVHPQTGIVYVARRSVIFNGAGVSGNSVELLRPRLDPDDPSKLEIFSLGALVFGALDSGGIDYRALAFSQDGTRLYIGVANPSSVLIVDTSLNDFGEPQNRIIARVDVDQVPEQLKVVPTPDGGELVYVADFTNARLHVVDPLALDSSGARTSIEVGEGPFGMDFVVLPDGGRRLIVANFDEDTLSVIDADPTSLTFNEVLYRVGAPRPAEED